ncbi:putative Gag polyprotein [Cricetulus griseus]|nr:putative Gag polyprotein [Cricetulus griseus]
MGVDESLSAFLEQLMEAFHCRFSPYDPAAEEHKATVTVAFIDQSARSIKKVTEFRRASEYGPLACM